MIEQFNLIAFLGQLAVEAGKYIFATHCENIATSLNFIADYILYSSALEKKLKLTAEKINRQAKKIKADLQLINGLWETLKNFDPVTFVKEFVEDLKKTFGKKTDNAHLTHFPNHTWHHHQDTKTLLLVPRNLNSAQFSGISHTGGAAIIRYNWGKSDKIEFK